MKEVLETLVKGLVEDKEAVEVTEKEGDRGDLILEVKVAESEVGKVIGRQGRVARAIRTVMKSVAGKDHKRVTVEFIG